MEILCNSVEQSTWPGLDFIWKTPSCFFVSVCRCVCVMYVVVCDNSIGREDAPPMVLLGRGNKYSKWTGSSCGIMITYQWYLCVYVCACVCASLCTFIWKMSIWGFNERSVFCERVFMFRGMCVCYGLPCVLFCGSCTGVGDLLPGLRCQQGHIKLQNRPLLHLSLFLFHGWHIILYLLSLFYSIFSYVFPPSRPGSFLQWEYLLIICLLCWTLQYCLLCFLSSVAFAGDLTKWDSDMKSGLSEPHLRLVHFISSFWLSSLRIAEGLWPVVQTQKSPK